MNIVILSGSPRKGGNTDLLAAAFAEGASRNHHVETLRVSDFDVHPCLGCDACFKNERHACCQRDGMEEIISRLAAADMLIIASPVYFYGISSQLKMVIDRLHNPVRDTFSITKAALLLAGASSKPVIFDAIRRQYELCLDFFGIESVGEVLAGRAHNKGDVAAMAAVEDARRLGLSV